jgi:hypothetical protein
MRHFGLSAPDQRWQQQQNALLFGEAGTLSREGVTKKLQVLLQACYDFGINPLPALRKCFPGLEWKYWKQEGMASIGREIETKLAATADFVWAVSSIELVSASDKLQRVDDKFVFWFSRISNMLRQMPRFDFNANFIAQ